MSISTMKLVKPEIITHQSSDGTLRIWNKGVLTTKHVELSDARRTDLMLSEYRRRDANKRISGEVMVESVNDGKMFNDIFPTAGS